MQIRRKFQLLLIFLLLTILISLSTGSVMFNLNEIIQPNPSQAFILWELRFPKLILGLFSGAGLALSGLYMQSVFRNPLAGPYVLGISSGASLGVAFVLLVTSSVGLLIFNIPIAAFLGAFLVMAIVIFASKYINDGLSILIIGLMVGSFTSAIVALLSYFAPEANLKKYLIWGMGNLSAVPNYLIIIVIFSAVLGLVIGLKNIKGLNVFPMGEESLISLGLKSKNIRFELFFVTCLMTASITAAAGPIAFIGLAMPHVARLWFKVSDHKILIPASALIGAICLLLCDIIAGVPGSQSILPINSISSLIGAPVVIYLMLKKNRLVL